MGMYIIPAPNSKMLWRLIVDGEFYEEGTLEEMEEAKERITLCRLFEEEESFDAEMEEDYNIETEACGIIGDSDVWDYTEEDRWSWEDRNYNNLYHNEEDEEE